MTVRMTRMTATMTKCLISPQAIDCGDVNTRYKHKQVLVVAPPFGQIAILGGGILLERSRQSFDEVVVPLSELLGMCFPPSLLQKDLQCLESIYKEKHGPGDGP